MARLRREYNPDKPARRNRRPIIYIICEGKETEPLYFRHFRSRDCLVDITPVVSKHKAAEHLVKHAQSLIAHADYYPKDGDQIWCVFDCDDNTDAQIQTAQTYAERCGYQIAYSNPSFEYWYLLHFEMRNGHLRDSNAAIEILRRRKYLEDYEKHTDVYDQLLPYQEEAIHRAKERTEQLRQNEISVLCRDSNPVTTVYRLVELLNSKRRG